MFNFFKKQAPTETEAIRLLNSLALDAKIDTVRNDGILSIMVLITKTGDELIPYVSHRKSISEFIACIEDRISNELPLTRAKDLASLGLPLEAINDSRNELSAAKRLLIDSKMSGLLRWHIDDENNLIVDGVG
jgi:hypothetical protein